MKICFAVFRFFCAHTVELLSANEIESVKPFNNGA